MVQVQLTHSHKNKRGLVAKCSSYISLCSWKPSPGIHRKEYAPGREVEAEDNESHIRRKSSRSCLLKWETFMEELFLTGCPQSSAAMVVLDVLQEPQQVTAASGMGTNAAIILAIFFIVILLGEGMKEDINSVFISPEDKVFIQCLYKLS